MYGLHPYIHITAAFCSRQVDETCDEPHRRGAAFCHPWPPLPTNNSQRSARCGDGEGLLIRLA